ncbi:MAG: hypothetical protein K2O34_14565 [Acetatifactor sp.]|nr:hypothetical protein [Acetatifactor sp.]
MASVFVVKGKIDTPREWYARETGCDSEWEYDELLKAYHTGEVYIKEEDDSVSFEDMSENEFFGWGTSSWITLAGDNELIYGYYSEDSCSAEFVHIRDGECIRDYRVYESEVDTDEGAAPPFDGWTDVAEYVDKNLL